VRLGLIYFDHVQTEAWLEDATDEEIQEYYYELQGEADPHKG